MSTTVLGLATARSVLRTVAEAASRQTCSRACIVPPLFLGNACGTLTPTRQYSWQHTIHAAKSAPYRRPRIWQRQLGARNLFAASPVLTSYTELPPTYEDEQGLQFSRKELDAQSVLQIFGSSIDTYAANKLLRILHGRRVAGTLDDPSLARHTSQYSKKHQDIALAYLRRTVPVDEIINAGLRAEDELAMLETEAGEENEADEPDKAESGDTSAESAASGKKPFSQRLSKKLYKDMTPTDVYGESTLDRIRARNIAKEKVRVKIEEEERKKREEEAAKANPGGLQTIDPSKPRELSPRMKEYAAAGMVSDLKEPPTMSKFQRLWPSALFVGALFLIGTGISLYYTPPETYQRLLPSIPMEIVTVSALVAVNVAVYLLWKAPPLWNFLNRYFILSIGLPRPLSLLGSIVSHQKFWHLFLNMLLLVPVSLDLHRDVGREKLIEIYALSGLFGYLASLAKFVWQNQLGASSIGASGAAYGVVVAYFLIHRYEGFKLFDLPPDPFNGIQGLGFVAALLGYNLLALTRGAKIHGADVPSHLGGMLIGAVYGQYYFLKKQREEEQQQKKNNPPGALMEQTQSDHQDVSAEDSDARKGRDQRLSAVEEATK